MREVEETLTNKKVLIGYTGGAFCFEIPFGTPMPDTCKGFIDRNEHTKHVRCISTSNDNGDSVVSYRREGEEVDPDFTDVDTGDLYFFDNLNAMDELISINKELKGAPTE